MSDRLVNDGECKVRSVPVSASQNIRTGDLVNIGSNGFALVATSGSSLVFGGVAIEDANNSTGANGDVDVKLACYGAVQLRFDSAVTNASLDSLVYVSGSGLVKTVSGSNPVTVGRILRLPPGVTASTTASVFLNLR